MCKDNDEKDGKDTFAFKDILLLLLSNALLTPPPSERTKTKNITECGGGGRRQIDKRKKNTGFCPERKVKAIMKTLVCISVSAQLSRKARR